MHDLRHSFVTIARDLDHGDHAIARVVGHVLNDTQTARYGAVRDQKTHACARETSAQIAILLGLTVLNDNGEHSNLSSEAEGWPDRVPSRPRTQLSAVA